MNAKFKKYVLHVTPSIMLDFYKCLRSWSNSRLLRIWEGVYDHYVHIGSSANTYYGSDEHVQDIESDMEGRLASAKRCKTIPMDVVGEHALLPLLASLLYERQGRLNILDFGGGAGIAYLDLLNSIRDCSSVRYHVVELAKVCEVGARLFQNDERIYFHSALPDDLRDIDILHMNSSLQYIGDYAGMLHRLCAYQAKYFLFIRLSAGDIPTYATVQRNLPGEPVPYWFLNVNELIEIMSKNNYSLLFKSAGEREYNQDNFPERYRLRRTCNLLFALHKVEEK